MTNSDNTNAISDRDIEIREVGLDELPVISRMNWTLFNERRIINRFDRADLMMLVAYADGDPVGFKVGYGKADGVYYSAKGGTVPLVRRRGIARILLDEMIDRAIKLGYQRFAFDTFPSLHVGMTLMAIDAGFVINGVDYSESMNAYRFRFIRDLVPPEDEASY